MVPQWAQAAAGRAEGAAGGAAESRSSDGGILEGGRLAARAEVGVGRRLHGGHARVVRVQV